VHNFPVLTVIGTCNQNWQASAGAKLLQLNHS